MTQVKPILNFKILMVLMILLDYLLSLLPLSTSSIMISYASHTLFHLVSCVGLPLASELSPENLSFCSSFILTYA